MADDENGASGEPLVDGLADAAFEVRIEFAHRFVQDQQLGVAQQRARQTQALALATGEPVRLLADPCLVPVGQGVDELGHARHVRRIEQELVRSASIGHADVVQHRAFDQVDVLAGHAQQGEPVDAQHFLQRQPIHGDRSLLRGVEAQQQVDDGGLAGATGSHQRGRAAGRYLERHARKSRRQAVGIAERNVVEADALAQRVDGPVARKIVGLSSVASIKRTERSCGSI